jgi:hypothetical protein
MTPRQRSNGFPQFRATPSDAAALRAIREAFASFAMEEVETTSTISKGAAQAERKEPVIWMAARARSPSPASLPASPALH